MSAIITTRFRIHAASLLKEKFDALATEDNYYLFVGEPREWAAPYDDTMPPPPQDHVQNTRDAWKTMLGLKRIIEVDVSYAIRRYTWETNTVYIPYSDDDEDLFNHPTEAEQLAADVGGYLAGPIYTVTSDFKVYKCIDNNGGAPSTIAPSGTSTSIFDPGDGYKWKYMYTVSAPEILKFVTQDWIPVKTLDADDGSFQWAVQAAATPNVISHVRVDEPGTGFIDIADGAIDTATPLTAVLATGGNGIDDSYNDSTIHIVGGTGAGQQRRITDYDGTGEEITIDTAWTTTPDNTSSYEIRPSITFSGDGSGAEGKVIVTGGVVSSIQVTNEGSGYHFASVLIEGGNTRLGGTVAEATPQIGPKGGHGSDAVQELGGHFLMANVQLAYDEGSGDFPIANEYRRLGIIFDPKVFGSPTVSATNNTLRATYQLQLSGISGVFDEDEIISDGTSSAKVVQYEDLGGGDGLVTYFQDEETGFVPFVATAQTVTGTVSSASGQLDGVTNPEVEPFSGEILYMEQRRPIARSIDQLEDIKTIIEF